MLNRGNNVALRNWFCHAYGMRLSAYDSLQFGIEFGEGGIYITHGNRRPPWGQNRHW